MQTSQRMGNISEPIRCHFCLWKAEVCEWKNCWCTNKANFSSVMTEIPLNNNGKKRFKTKTCQEDNIIELVLETYGKVKTFFLLGFKRAAIKFID